MVALPVISDYFQTHSFTLYTCFGAHVSKSPVLSTVIMHALQGGRLLKF